MQEPLLRKLFLAFIEVHILHHAKEEPIFGSWMKAELESHGYEISAGTLYPIFHNMEKNGYLLSKNITVKGKVRKYYTTTPKGEEVLQAAYGKINELKTEM